MQTLNRAIFLYPICIVTAFVLGGSALIGPASLRAPFLSKGFAPEEARPYISPISPLYLPYISPPLSPQGFRPRGGAPNPNPDPEP